jgi:AcrR family transcriptional regulator
MEPRAPDPERSRRPGRPRSVRIDRAILAAAVDLFAAEGLEGMSMEAVAARARVGKAALYRRWSSKEDLVTAALGSLVAEERLPSTGSLRGDLTALLRGFEHLIGDTPLGRAFPRMVGEIWTGTPLGLRYAATVIAPRREAATRLLLQGIAEGELAPDTNVPVLIDTLVGALIVRYLRTAMGEAVPREASEQIVDFLLGGPLAGSEPA